MPRPPRTEFAGANYHIITRGDGRRPLFHDNGHYERFTKGLQDEVQRSGWIVLAYCWMPNHIHCLLQTPEPNLARGMQHWLSGYANWYAKRNQRTGHLYQGRYKAFLVEDAGYYWTLSRYIHLNPCNGARPLASDPESWPHSSFGGYARKSKRVDWVQYDQLHTYWSASVGGKNPDRAYRQYVKEGLNFADDPFKKELREWVFGSEDFLRRMVGLAEGNSEQRGGGGGLSMRQRGLMPSTHHSTPSSVAKQQAAIWPHGCVVVGPVRPCKNSGLPLALPEAVVYLTLSDGPSNGERNPKHGPCGSTKSSNPCP